MTALQNLVNLLLLFLSIHPLPPCNSFLVQPLLQQRHAKLPSSIHPRYNNDHYQNRLYITTNSNNNPNEGPILTLDNIPSKFQPLFTQASLTTSLSRKPVTNKQAHDPFRYEWGTWVDEHELKTLMDRIDEVLIGDGGEGDKGAYEKLVDMAEDTDTTPPYRYKIASGNQS